MLWVIILVVVGMAFAPAMWLRPTARERHLGKLRDAAVHSHVSVKLETSPLHGDNDKMAAYRWPYPAQRPGPVFMLVREAHASQALKLCEPGWRWRIEPLRPMPPSVNTSFLRLLSKLPADACVVESNAKALTLWWDESLDAEDFCSLAAPAAALRDALQGRPDQPSGGVPGAPI